MSPVFPPSKSIHLALIVVFVLRSPSSALSSTAPGMDCGLQERGKVPFSVFLSLSRQSSIQDWGEEVEEGAVYHVTLKRVQIQQAANKGARWLGVSEAGAVALWKAADGLWSLLHGAGFHTSLCDINF